MYPVATSAEWRVRQQAILPITPLTFLQ
jgi:hypothetical protein